MNKYPRGVGFGLTTALMLGTAAFAARYEPVTDPLVVEECGSCHLVYQPQMLPVRSWLYLMSTLEDHFGDDASMEPSVLEHVADYYARHAADVGQKPPEDLLMTGLPNHWMPTRITDLPAWKAAHSFGSAQVLWQFGNVKSSAQCDACHRYAPMGVYGTRSGEHTETAFSRDQIIVRQPWIRASLIEDNTAHLYLQIQNHGDQPARISKVESPLRAVRARVPVRIEAARPRAQVPRARQVRALRPRG